MEGIQCDQRDGPCSCTHSTLSSHILPTSGKLRPRPSKTPEQRLKDREITWGLLAIRQVATKVGVNIAEEELRLGSAGKVYLDRNLIAVINKDAGTVSWKHDKLAVVGLKPEELEEQRLKVKAESLSR